MHGLTWPTKRGHVAHAHDGGNNQDINNKPNFDTE